MSTGKAVVDGTFHNTDENRNLAVIEHLLSNVRVANPKKFKEMEKRYRGKISKETSTVIQLEGISILAGSKPVAEVPEAVIESEAFKKIMENRPKNATALVLAQYMEDKGNAVTGSYFKLLPTRNVALSWRTRQRDSFKVLREIAATFEETKHLGPDAPAEIEHREHPQKRGSYLKQGDYHANGWVVQSIGLSELRKYKNMEDKLIEYTETKEEKKPEVKQELTVSKNADKHSVELTFTVKPARSLIKQLQKKGWSATKNRKFWFKLSSPDAETFAETLKKRINN